MPKRDPYKVLIVEDDEPTLKHLEQAISDDTDFIVEAACTTLKQALITLRTGAPDIIVTDLQLPDGHGTTLIRQAKEQLASNAEIMVISVLGDEHTVVEAIEAGASGYILKDAEPVDIAATLHTLLKGGSPISSGIARYILKRLQHDKKENESERRALLSAKEKSVLERIARGYSYADVASDLEISINTVATHIKRIYQKLEVNSGSQAVYRAMQEGLIDADE